MQPIGSDLSQKFVAEGQSNLHQAVLATNHLYPEKPLVRRIVYSDFVFIHSRLLTLSSVVPRSTARSADTRDKISEALELGQRKEDLAVGGFGGMRRVGSSRRWRGGPPSMNLPRIHQLLADREAHRAPGVAERQLGSRPHKRGGGAESGLILRVQGPGGTGRQGASHQTKANGVPLGLV